MDGFEGDFIPDAQAAPEPKPAKEAKPKKPKRDPATDPRLIDKIWKFMRPFDWEVAANEKKRITLPGITDIVSLDKTGWGIVSTWAGRIGYSASLFNLLLVTIYACTVASQSQFQMLANSGPIVSGLAWFLLMILATGIAAVLQLATDFALPWAAGLAGEKYRISPSAIIIAWLFFFMPTTLIMKYDLYSSWGHQRESEIVKAQTESSNDKAILDKYAASPPPAIEASDAIIAASPALLFDMKAERDRLVAARDQEKQYLGSSKTGMGQRWRELNAQTEDINKRIEAQVAKETGAKAAKQDRLDYDAAKTRYEGNAAITANGGASLRLLYDHPIVVWLRVLGGAFVSMIAILVHFVALRMAADARAVAEAKAKKSEAAIKGHETRRNRPVETEFEEAAPLTAPRIPNFGDVQNGAVAQADTPTIKRVDPSKHPDRAGDDFGAKSNGREKPELDLTDQVEGDENGTDEPGKPAHQ